MSNIDTIRHDEVFAAHENDHPITIVGAGAIGSRVFAALAELGLTHITTYDFDEVEGHNLANQIYGTNDIGKPKVAALSDWYSWKTKAATPDNMHFIETKVDSTVNLHGTVFLLVDSMAARKQIFKENISENPDVWRVIDVRMASTHGNVMMFNPHTQGDQWLSTLIDDDTAEMSACGSSLSVGTTASILSNLAAWQYMHAKTNPAAADDILNVYLKPLTIAAQNWEQLS